MGCVPLKGPWMPESLSCQKKFGQVVPMARPSFFWDYNDSGLKGPSRTSCPWNFLNDLMTLTYDHDLWPWWTYLTTLTYDLDGRTWRPWPMTLMDVPGDLDLMTLMDVPGDLDLWLWWTCLATLTYDLDGRTWWPWSMTLMDVLGDLDLRPWWTYLVTLMDVPVSFPPFWEGFIVSRFIGITTDCWQLKWTSGGHFLIFFLQKSSNQNKGGHSHGCRYFFWHDTESGLWGPFHVAL